MSVKLVGIWTTIRRLREESGISQTQIADYLDIDQSMVSKIESGERNPSIEMIEKLSALFGCELDSSDESACDNGSLKFAFRANGVSNEDLEAIASINRIAMNLHEMKDLLRGAAN